MKLNDILFIIEINTKIEVFIDDKKTSILYPSPIRVSLIKKRYYDITNIDANDNKLVLYLTSNNDQTISTNYNNQTLFDILPLIKNKKNLKIFHNNMQITTEQKYLNNTIDKIFTKNNIVNILLK